MAAVLSGIRRYLLPSLLLPQLVAPVLAPFLPLPAHRGENVFNGNATRAGGRG